MKNETAQAAKDKQVLDAAIQQTVEFTPFLEGKPIKITRRDCRELFATPTRSGKLPTDAQIELFLKLCESRKLNPFAKDAFLVGYDAKDGPKFDGLVAHKALYKRAEANKSYDGLESGVIIYDATTKEVKHIRGDVAPSTVHLIGGWAKVFRKDRSRPAFKTCKYTAYKKDSGVWLSDGGWMITKCAEAKALREAFPNDLGDMYAVEEAGAMENADTYHDRTHNAEVFHGGTAIGNDLRGITEYDEVATVYEPTPEELEDIQRAEQKLFETSPNAAEN